MPASLFTLPTELRLEVYHHLIISSLDEGKPGSIAGLFSSCRAVHGEMNDLIGKVQLLLTTQSKRKSAHPDSSPLRIQLPAEYGFIKALTIATIELPHSGSWYQISDYRLSEEANKAFTVCSTAIIPLLTSAWSTLVLETKCLAPDTDIRLEEREPTGFFRIAARTNDPLRRRHPDPTSNQHA